MPTRVLEFPLGWAPLTPQFLLPEGEAAYPQSGLRKTEAKASSGMAWVTQVQPQALSQLPRKSHDLK